LYPKQDGASASEATEENVRCSGIYLLYIFSRRSLNNRQGETMKIRTQAQLHFGKTIIITGPSETKVNERLHEEHEKANGAIGVLASQFGDQYRGRLLTGPDITRFFDLVDIPFQGSEDIEKHKAAIAEAFQKFASPRKATDAVIGYALTQEASGRARFINLKA
jgi:hypothetical protein